MARSKKRERLETEVRAALAEFAATVEVRVQAELERSRQAQLALIELRGVGRLVFGGCLDGDETLAVLQSPDPAEAAGWLVEAGSWTTGSLRTRPFIHVL